MITPIVTVCTLGLLSAVYRFVEHKNACSTVNSIRLHVNGQQYIIAEQRDLPSANDFLYSWAIDFCSTEGLKFGFDASTFSQCTGPLISALKLRNKKGKNKGGESRINLTLAPKLRPWYDVPTENTPTVPVVSETSTEESEPAETTESVEEILFEEKSSPDDVQLESAVNNASDSPQDLNSEISAVTDKIPLEINGITYVFEYIVTADKAERNSIARQLAVSFCEMHGAELVDKERLALLLQDHQSVEGGPSQNALVENLLRRDCVEPISGALVVNMKYP